MSSSSEEEEDDVRTDNLELDDDEMTEEELDEDAGPLSVPERLVDSQQVSTSHKKKSHNSTQTKMSLLRRVPARTYLFQESLM